MAGRSFLLGSSLLVLAGCQGQGCSDLPPLEDGFPAAERRPNATQLRLSSAGLASLASDPELVVATLLGGESALPVAASCAGDSPVCCPGGVPGECSIDLDVTAQPGDQPRLQLSPAQGASRLDVRLRARMKTIEDIPVTIPLVGACGMSIDSTAGSSDDFVIDVPLSFQQDPSAGTTRLELGTLSLTGLTDDDVSLQGSFGCQIANTGLGFYMDVLTSTLADAFRSTLDGQLCKPCAAGDVQSCGTFADACTDGVCMIGQRCVQELGISGRLLASTLFGGAPPGSAGSTDVYEIAGGYATTNTSGLALGHLVGLLPGGHVRERCGPAATAPAAVTVPPSAFFQGNTRPDNGQPFQAAIGLHRWQLDQFAYAAYEGGLFCPTLGSAQLPQLSSASLQTSAPSLENLTGGAAPLAVGFRAQKPPSYVLGANSFDANAEVAEPLLDFSFEQMEIDVFADVELQPLRIMTLVADVRVPLGVVPHAPGQLLPVLGSGAGLSNLSVRNSEALQEAPEDLAAIEPLITALVLPELIRSLGTWSLPSVLGMQLDVDDVALVDNQSFIGVFADLVPPGAGQARTSRDEQQGAAPPTSGHDAPPSLPRAWALAALSLLGIAALLRQRRRTGSWRRASALAACAVLAPVGCGDDGSGGRTSPGNGGESQGGHDEGSGGSSESHDSGGTMADGGSSPAVDGGATGLAGAGGETGEPNPCGDQACLPGEVAGGGLGQWSSADSGARTVITSYDSSLGDLVLVELTGATESRRVIDGIAEATPTHEPSGYRGGVVEAGPDVGAWSSVRLFDERVVVAYQDLERAALRVAFEDEEGKFSAHDLDVPTEAGIELGAFASLAVSSVPAVAYLATNVPGSGDERLTELRLAVATSATPRASQDWAISVVATAAEPVGAAVSDFPGSIGSFVNLLALADGRWLLVHYDRTQRALVAHLETSPDSGTFVAATLDSAAAGDRGKWASAVLGDDEVVHVAYVDAVSQRVLYTTFTPGGSVAAPEIVDDGMRDGERPHWVGAGTSLWLEDGIPRVAYQDAFSADVMVASKDGVWSHTALTTGAALDGFHLATAPHGAGPLVWDRLDSSAAAAHQLVIEPAP